MLCPLTPLDVLGVSDRSVRLVVPLRGVVGAMTAPRVIGGGWVSSEAERQFVRGMWLGERDWLGAAGALGQAARVGHVRAMWALGEVQRRRGGCLPASVEWYGESAERGLSCAM
jgi:hypothetical protein